MRHRPQLEEAASTGKYRLRKCTNEVNEFTTTKTPDSTDEIRYLADGKPWLTHSVKVHHNA